MLNGDDSYYEQECGEKQRRVDKAFARRLQVSSAAELPNQHKGQDHDNTLKHHSADAAKDCD